MESNREIVDDPAVKFSFFVCSDPLEECCVVCVRGVLEDHRERSIKEFNKKSRCLKCMLTCCCCFCVHLFVCCGMFNEAWSRVSPGSLPWFLMGLVH